MAGPVSGDRAEFGVLFVDGIGGQRPGSAVASLGAALFGWLFRWNRAVSLSVPEAPALGKTVVCGEAGGTGEPAYATLETSLLLSNGERHARWLLAESSWASAHAPPSFLELGRWIWKVSTCLLVLQFVIPMRRHWRQYTCDAARGVPLGRRMDSAAAAFAYLALMGVGAMLSVLLSIVLLVLALAALLPIPRIEGAVQWVVVQLSAILGDSYLLAHCPVQFAAMRTKVADDLRWLQDRCDVVAVVAHSQGAALAHQVLREDGRARGVRAFITIGQGISKLHLLQRMDWDPAGRRGARRSRSFVVAGLLLAGLPALGAVASRFGVPALHVLAELPVFPPLIAAGFSSLVVGVWQAVRANDRQIDPSFVLPGADFNYLWSDYYASADPVSNGRFAEHAGPRGDRSRDSVADGLPSSCREVLNKGSLLTDHNSYLHNQDQFLPWLLNDLVAAAYGEPQSGSVIPRLVADEDIQYVTGRRRRLIRWLIGVRGFTLSLGVALWWLTPRWRLATPVNKAMHAVDAHMSVGNLTLRLAVIILAMIVSYTAVGVIPWRMREGRTSRNFFQDAKRYGDPPSSEQTDARQTTGPWALHRWFRRRHLAPE